MSAPDTGPRMDGSIHAGGSSPIWNGSLEGIDPEVIANSLELLDHRLSFLDSGAGFDAPAAPWTQPDSDALPANASAFSKTGKARSQHISRRADIGHRAFRGNGPYRATARSEPGGFGASHVSSRLTGAAATTVPPSEEFDHEGLSPVQASKAQAVHALRLELENLGYEEADIALIEVSKGGRHALQAVGKLTIVLETRGYEKVDIVAIANRSGGGQALHAVYLYGPYLERRGYTKADIVRTALIGGAYGVLAVYDLTTDLERYGYPKADIIGITARLRGATAIRAVHQLTASLEQHDYRKADIVMIATFGGASALQVVDKLGPELEHRGYPRPYIMRLAKRAHVEALRAIHECGPELEECRFSKSRIMDIGDRAGGAPALRAIRELMPALIRSGVPRREIVEIAISDGVRAKDTLQRVIASREAQRCAAS